MKQNILYFFILSLLIAGCTSTREKLYYSPKNSSSPEFSKHWFSGTAEIAVYEVQQSRYGNARKGQAVLITVSEPFAKAQVKADNPNTKSYDVLKTNLIKRYRTGIYDYSVMTSAFVPINVELRQPVAKITNSVQDWCGQAFVQANYMGEGYKATLHSYFQGESDAQIEFKGSVLADEVYSQIRINPKQLPVGDIAFVASMELYRYWHRPIKALEAKAKLVSKGDTTFYQIKTSDMLFEWSFSSSSPHTIYSWKEEVQDHDGGVNQALSSYAELKEVQQHAYWNKNGVGYEALRNELGINFFEN